MIDLIDKLQMLDIPRRESEVYLALLQKKEFTAPEIAKVTTVSRTKAYEVLQNLVKKGLCNETYRNGVKVFSAVNPKIVLDNYLFEYDEKKRALGLLSKSLGEIYAQKVANTDPLDYIEVLTELNQIKERWLNIQRTTERELLIFTKQPYLVPLEENIEDEVKLFKEKHITGKSIYEYHDLTPEGCKTLIGLIETYEKIGEENYFCTGR
jgi:sugar-specific transcriptional regulator TrmB